jgi:putative tryptophan/tyrosine transport system substrate-binding protein
MRRREFITLIGGGAVAYPLAARAQQGRKARIGFLGLVSASSHAPRVAALRAGLRDLGWIEGQNIQIDFRWAEGQYDRLSASRSMPRTSRFGEWHVLFRMWPSK